MSVVARYFARNLLMTCLVLVSTSGHVESQQNGNQSPLKVGVPAREVVRSLEKAIPRLMKDGDVTGLSIVLIRNSKIYWHRGFGVKNADTRAPIDDATIFKPLPSQNLCLPTRS